MMKNLSIGELAKATNTPAETIRYYEKIGLLEAPPRSDANYRRYRPEDQARLSFVRRVRDLGFSIEQVRTLLYLSDQQELDCSTVDSLVLEHLAAIERKIADLTDLKQQLSTLVTSCRGGTVANCRILGALGPLDGHAEAGGAAKSD